MKERLELHKYKLHNALDNIGPILQVKKNNLNIPKNICKNNSEEVGGKNSKVEYLNMLKDEGSGKKSFWKLFHNW